MLAQRKKNPVHGPSAQRSVVFLPLQAAPSGAAGIPQGPAYFAPRVHKEQDLWEKALGAVVRGERCMLLLVVESIGSSPGRAGFKALVTSSGELYGSIGGGSMEHKLVELAKVRIARGSSAPDGGQLCAPLLKRQVHRAEEAVDRSGMICSGEQTVVLYPIDQAHQAFLAQLIDTLDKPAGQVLHVDGTGLSIRPAPRVPAARFARVSEARWTYTEPLEHRPRIVILGAGHVGLALSRTMHQLGFHVHLMDDRADLNTLVANRWADVRSVVDYNQINRSIRADPELYIVLVSFGYRTDALLVRQLVRQRFKYLGMMGSAGKIAKLLADMRQDGYSEEELARIRAPIGLPIRSRTPEEIAVSIAAEIIGVKNGA